MRQKLCAMPLVTRDSRRPRDIRGGDQCTWTVDGELDGVPLCWVHARSVKDGRRPLPLTQSGVKK